MELCIVVPLVQASDLSRSNNKSIVLTQRIDGSEPPSRFLLHALFILNRYMQTFIRKKPGFIALCFSLLVVTACQTEDTDKEPVTKKPKVEKITVANDFVVEHLYRPSENEKGSWLEIGRAHV